MKPISVLFSHNISIFETQSLKVGQIVIKLQYMNKRKDKMDKNERKPVSQELMEANYEVFFFLREITPLYTRA
jgi:hypothetical protein